jgi:alcohol dehydrogenase class IV
VADLHHGLANALMIEPVLRFNLEAVPQKFAELAHVVGLSDGNEFLGWLAKLKAQIGITPGLSSRGVQRAQFERLVQIASTDICGQTNPRSCSPADFERFFSQAL